MADGLTYDNLPAGSSVLREYVDGGLRVTAPAGEVSSALRRLTARRAAVPAAVITAAALLLCMLAFGSTALGHRNLLPWWWPILFGLFCAALFLFVWQVRYVNQLDALERALAQNTIIAARHGRLLIESSGPLGAASVDLPREQIAAIGVRYNHRRGQWGQEQPIDCLAIVPRQGEVLLVLGGRLPDELLWVRDALLSALELR